MFEYNIAQNPCYCNKKRRVETRRFLNVVRTIDAAPRPDLFAFSSGNKGKQKRCRRRADGNHLSAGQMILSFQICPYINKNPNPDGFGFSLEVPARFELANESFADSCLTTWPRYRMEGVTRLELATSTLARWRSTG